MNAPLDEEDLIARYRALPRPEPSAALDAAVLAHARAAVRRTRPAWVAPIAAAAVVVLAVAVGWQLRGVPLEPVMPQPAGETSSAERAADAPSDAIGAGPATASTADRNHALAAPSPAAPPAPAPAAEAKAEREQQATRDAAPFADAPPVAARAAAAPAPPPAPPPPPAEPAQIAENVAKRQRAESAPAPPAPPAASAAPIAPAPPAALMAAEAPVANEVGQSEIDQAELDPDAWVDAVRRLRDAGDEAAARRELQRLLQRHPDIDLPDDLRGLRD